MPNEDVIKLAVSRDSFQSIYKKMDAVSVFIAFEIIYGINELKGESTRDVKEFIRAEVAGKLEELEKRKSRSWMITQALLLQRTIASVMSSNRKSLEFMIYAYDIGDSMFAYEKNILEIVLKIDGQVNRLEGP